MIQTCGECGCEFGPGDLAPAETDAMEADRRAAGLRDVRFRYFTCGACGGDAIFVDLRPLAGEVNEHLQRRRAEMEAVVRGLHANSPARGAAVTVRVIIPA